MGKHSLIYIAALLFPAAPAAPAPAAPVMPLAFWEHVAGDNDDALLAMVGSCAKSGQLAKAIGLAKRIKDEEMRDTILRDFYWNVSTPAEARVLLPWARESWGADESPGALAVLLAKAGDMPAALKLNAISRREDPFFNDLENECAAALTLKDLRLAVAEIPKIMPQALQRLKHVKLDEDYMKLLQARESRSCQAAANRAAELGDVKLAKQLMEKAFALATAAEWVTPDRIHPPFAKHPELEPLARKMMIQAGKQDWPRFCGRTSAAARDHTLGCVRDNALTFLKAGKPKLAEACLEHTKNFKILEYTLNGLARHYVVKKDLAAARPWIKRVRDPWDRYQLHRAIAEHHIAQGQNPAALDSLKQALAAYRKCNTDDYYFHRPKELAELARLFAQAGNAKTANRLFHEALLAASQEKYESTRLSDFARIAFEQARAARVQFQAVLDGLKNFHQAYLKPVVAPKDPQEKMLFEIRMKSTPDHAWVLAAILRASSPQTGALVRRLVQQEIQFAKNGGQEFYLAMIADWHGAHGRFAPALDLAGHLKSPQLRARLQRRLAKYLATQPPAKPRELDLRRWASAKDDIEYYWRPMHTIYSERLNQATPLKAAFTPAQQKTARRIRQLFAKER